jgi:hypothetical protein
MGAGFGQWLVRSFSLFGIQFQNWMAVAAGILALWILYHWLKKSLHRSDRDS